LADAHGAAEDLRDTAYASRLGGLLLVGLTAGATVVVEGGRIPP
jgi:hypothetical protein